jgi:hypothetical protein
MDRCRFKGHHRPCAACPVSKFKSTPANRHCLHCERQPHRSSLSIKFTPTASIGIVADTLGLSYLYMLPLAQSHRLSSLGTHPVSLLRFLRIVLLVFLVGSILSFLHHCCFVFFLCCCSCSCSSSTVGLLRVSFTLYNLLESYGLSCSSIILTKQSSNSIHSCGRSVDPQLHFVVQAYHHSASLYRSWHSCTS